LATARSIRLRPQALEDLRHWVEHDARTARRVLALLESARRTPFEGAGRPEPLRHMGPDLWSRRITREDRLVYRVLDDAIDVLQARYHY
jgi:toxin YoeB